MYFIETGCDTKFTHSTTLYKLPVLVLLAEGQYLTYIWKVHKPLQNQFVCSTCLNMWDVLVTFYVDSWFCLTTRTKPFQGRMCFCLLPHPPIISTKLSFVSSAYIISNSFAGSKSICRLLSKSYFSFFLLIGLFKRLVHFTCPEFEQS